MKNNGGVPNPERFQHVFCELLQGYLNYDRNCEIEIKNIKEAILAERVDASRVIPDSLSSPHSRFGLQQLKTNIELLAENRRLYQAHVERLENLYEEYQAANSTRMKEFPTQYSEKSRGSTTDLHSIPNSHRRNPPNTAIFPSRFFEKKPNSSIFTRFRTGGARANIENRRQKLGANYASTGELNENHLYQKSAPFSSTTLIHPPKLKREEFVETRQHFCPKNSSSLLRRTNANAVSAANLNYNFSSTSDLYSGLDDTEDCGPKKELSYSNLYRSQPTSTSLWDLSKAPVERRQPKRNFIFSSRNRLFGSASLLRLDEEPSEENSSDFVSNFTESGANLAKMSALETEMAGMLGRFHFEIKAIIGFARLAAGDSFEVSVKHGSQRWKTRGKTQPDRSQHWDQSTVALNCVHDAPIIIKVVELKFFKSKCLNERNFDAAKFFSAQPQLVTMNLNSIGSLKLQLVITWLPLLSSKSGGNGFTLASTNDMSRSMATIPRSPTMFKHAKQISSASQIYPVSSNRTNGGYSSANGNLTNGRSKSIDSPDFASRRSQRNEESTNDDIRQDEDHENVSSSPSLRRSNATASISSSDIKNNNTSNTQNVNGDSDKNNNNLLNNNNGGGVDDSPPKICLREKKRERERGGRAAGGKGSAASSAYSSVISIGAPLDKNRWRHSSTTILDSLYRDLSKNIPTIDDLAVLSSSRTNLHKLSGAGIERKFSTSSQSKGASKSSNDSNTNGSICNGAQPSSISSSTLRPPLSASRDNWNKSASVANLAPIQNENGDNDGQDHNGNGVENSNYNSSQSAKISPSCFSSPSKASETEAGGTIATASSSSMNGSLNGSVGGSSGVKKSRLSSLKKNRHNPSSADYYARVPIAASAQAMIAASNNYRPSRPFSTICNASTTVDDADEQLLDAFSFQMRQSHQHHAAAIRASQNSKSSLCSIAETAAAPNSASISLQEALRAANALLSQIESLRALLSRANNSVQDGNAELAELVGFEACMLNWEAILKLNRAAILEDLRMCRSGAMFPPLSGRAANFSKRTSLYLPQQAPPYFDGNNHSTNNNWSNYHHNRNLSHPSEWSQHSPSTASDETDENGTSASAQQNGGIASLNGSNGAPIAISSTMDQISENDSGIDSLRQHISPYNRQQNGTSAAGVGNASKNGAIAANGSATLSGGDSTAQRRFKQFKERRKSLGVVLDTIQSSRRDSIDQIASPPQQHFDALRLDTSRANFHHLNPVHPPLSSSVSSASASSSESRRNSGSNPPVAPRSTVSGYGEVDESLRHHLERAIGSLERINEIQSTPFEFTLSELLCRMEQDTIALETLMHIVGQLPTLPNLCNLFNDLAVAKELRELWLAATFPLKVILVLPSEAIRHRIRSFVQPIVEARYPKLVDNVVDSMMSFMCERSGKWDNAKVTLFQFVAFFGAKNLSVFVENVSHEAWITSNLESRSISQVREVLGRLRNVPVVPPLESLRHIALVLATADSNSQIVVPIEKYLKNASVDLANDLTASFMCILEHEDDSSRFGACKALSILKHENSFNHLEFLAANDSYTQVRLAARQALAELRQQFYQIHHQNQKHHHFTNGNANHRASYLEVTKI